MHFKYELALGWQNCSRIITVLSYPVYRDSSVYQQRACNSAIQIASKGRPELRSLGLTMAATRLRGSHGIAISKKMEFIWRLLLIGTMPLDLLKIWLPNEINAFLTTIHIQAFK